MRGAHLISAVIYLGLAVSAASLSLGLGMSGGDGVHDGTAWLLAKPFGRWLVALVGLGVIGGGFGFLGKAWRGDVTDRLALDAQARDRWAGPVGRFGYAARGIAFLIIGGFLWRRPGISARRTRRAWPRPSRCCAPSPMAGSCSRWSRPATPPSGRSG